MTDTSRDDDAIVERLSVFLCRAELVQPLQLVGGHLSERNSLLLCWQVEGGELWTEVAPLTGFSRETLPQCIEQLANQVLPLLPARLSTLLHLAQHCFPSVSFGIGALTLSAKLVSCASVRVCRLLADRDDTVDVAAEACIKVKVGRNLPQEMALIRRLCCDSASVSLRLDANRQCSAAEIRALNQQLDLQRIEWLEEPCSDMRVYRDWSTVSQIPFALDENLYQTKSEPEYNDGLRALILKPMLLGFQRTQMLAQWAKRRRCRVVISSSFETGIGMQYLYALAYNLAPWEYHGLDTLKYFSPSYQLPEPHAYPSNLELIL